MSPEKAQRAVGGVFFDSDGGRKNNNPPEDSGPEGGERVWRLNSSLKYKTLILLRFWPHFGLLKGAAFLFLLSKIIDFTK
eukprot:6293513-Pyramimonas_sp.AAC.1